MKEKIDSLARLTQLLSNDLKKYDIVIQTLLNTNNAEEPRIAFNGGDTVTYMIPGCEVITIKIFKENNDNEYFLYNDKQNLCYNKDNIKDKGIALHNRLILDKPTYNEVYNFLYSYYICPLSLNKDSYNCLNKIYKRKK